MKRVVCAMMLTSLVGCAYKPIIDTAGTDAGKYASDLRECRQYASRLSTGNSAAFGALAGAVIGLAVGKAAGAESIGAVARTGAVIGAFEGLGGGTRSQRDVVSRCLSGRGYTVLY